MRHRMKNRSRKGSVLVATVLVVLAGCGEFGNRDSNGLTPDGEQALIQAMENGREIELAMSRLDALAAKSLSEGRPDRHYSDVASRLRDLLLFQEFLLGEVLKETRSEEQNSGFRALVEAWRCATADAAGGVDEYFVLAELRSEEASAVLGSDSGHLYSREGEVACAD